MAYNTRYTLEVSAEMDFQDFGMWILSNDEARFALNLRGETNEPCSWYEHEKDLRELSKSFPEIRFTLSGDGEEKNDLWKKYFLNGKMQEARGVITYNAFDPTKLV